MSGVQDQKNQNGSRLIICDEQRPACANCTKTGRVCPGLPDEADLIFRAVHPGLKKARKFSKRHSPDATKPETAIASGRGEEICTAGRGEKTCTAALLKQTSFHPALEKVATTLFLNAFITQQRQIDTNSGFMELIIPMFLASSEGSTLHLATEALALAGLSKWPGCQHLDHKASQAYSRALHDVRKSLRDPKQATSNAMLETILLLSLYESTTCSPESVKSWASHIEGAAAIVIARGVNQILDAESLLLFRAVRSQMLINAVQQRKPIPAFPHPKGWAADLEDLDTPAAAILNHTVRLTALLAKARPILSLRRRKENIAKVVALLQEAVQLMADMAEVELRTPSAWRCRSVVNMCDVLDVEKIAETDVWPHGRMLHVYEDLRHVWTRNDDRISHMLCCATVCDAVKWLHPTQESYRQNPTYAVAKGHLQVLVDDICASVPYYWHGQDLGLGSSTTPKRRTASEAIGGYGLIWPLYVASNIEEVPEIQRQWLRGRFAAIGRHYGSDETEIIYSLNSGRTGANWDPLVPYGEYMGREYGPGAGRPGSYCPLLTKQAFKGSEWLDQASAVATVGTGDVVTHCPPCAILETGAMRDEIVVNGIGLDHSIGMELDGLYSGVEITYHRSVVTSNALTVL